MPGPRRSAPVSTPIRPWCLCSRRCSGCPSSPSFLPAWRIRPGPVGIPRGFFLRVCPCHLPHWGKNSLLCCGSRFSSLGQQNSIEMPLNTHFQGQGDKPYWCKFHLNRRMNNGHFNPGLGSVYLQT